jgi:hypothetical protein
MLGSNCGLSIKEGRPLGQPRLSYPILPGWLAADSLVPAARTSDIPLTNVESEAK